MSRSRARSALVPAACALLWCLAGCVVVSEPARPCDDASCAGAASSVAGASAGAGAGEGAAGSAGSDGETGAEIPQYASEMAVPIEGCTQTSAPAQLLTVGGIATASDPGEGGRDSIARAFDDNSGTKWAVSANPTPWIAYEFAGTDAHVVTTYTLTACGDGNGAHDPRSWQLQGSNDGPGATALSWVTLDERQDELFAARYHTRAFAIDNTVAYHRYRLLVTANGGAPGLQLAELHLLGGGTPAFSIDDADSDDPRNRFSFSSGWDGHTFDNTSERFAGTSSWSATPGEYAEIAFEGSQIELYGVRDLKHGILGVSVDGGAETMIDLYGPTTEYNTLVFTSAVRCSGPHTLRVHVMGAKDPRSSGVYVSLDRAKVIP